MPSQHCQCQCDEAGEEKRICQTNEANSTETMAILTEERCEEETVTSSLGEVSGFTSPSVSG